MNFQEVGRNSLWKLFWDDKNPEQVNLYEEMGGISNVPVTGVVTTENFGPRKALLPGRLCPAMPNSMLPPESFCDGTS